MTNNLIQVLKSEHLKVKRNFGIKVIILFPVIIALFVISYLIYSYPDLEGGTFLYNPWKVLLGRHTLQFYPVIYPIIISIVCHSMCYVEYQNNSYKLIFTLPFEKSKLYIAKIILLIEIILISCLLVYVLYLGSGTLLSIIMPDYQFQYFDCRGVAFALFWKLFLSLTCIASIQYCISLAFKNFAVSIGGASFLTICSIILLPQYPNISNYIPYYSTNKVVFSFYQEIISLEEYNIICIIITTICFFLGYYIFKNKSKRV